MGPAEVLGRFAVLEFMHFSVYALDAAVEGGAAEELVGFLERSEVFYWVLRGGWKVFGTSSTMRFWMWSVPCAQGGCGLERRRNRKRKADLQHPPPSHV